MNRLSAEGLNLVPILLHKTLIRWRSVKHIIYSQLSSLIDPKSVVRLQMDLFDTWDHCCRTNSTDVIGSIILSRNNGAAQNHFCAQSVKAFQIGQDDFVRNTAKLLMQRRICNFVVIQKQIRVLCGFPDGLRSAIAAGLHGGMDLCMLCQLQQAMAKSGCAKGSPPERVSPPPVR